MTSPKGLSSLTIPHQPTVKTLILYGIIYADDCVVFYGSDKGLQRMMTVLDKVTTAFGREIAEKKIEVLCNKFLVSTTQANTHYARIPPPLAERRRQQTARKLSSGKPHLLLWYSVLSTLDVRIAQRHHSRWK
jgi:hypothetical protein